MGQPSPGCADRKPPGEVGPVRRLLGGITSSAALLGFANRVRPPGQGCGKGVAVACKKNLLSALSAASLSLRATLRARVARRDAEATAPNTEAFDKAGPCPFPPHTSNS